MSYQYLRGLDGVTVEGAPTQNRRSDDNLRSNDTAQTGNNSRNGERNAPPVEWPEGRDQRDYLRRLVDQRLGQSDWRHPETEVQAIGIIGNDVHDKLMILQALRNSFQDRTVFTTDLDARLLHPVVNRVHAQSDRGIEHAAGARRRSAMRHRAVSRFLSDRDVPRRALRRDRASAPKGQDDSGSCRALNVRRLEGRIGDAIAHPLLFEIGRDGLVELAAATGGAQASAEGAGIAPRGGRQHRCPDGGRDARPRRASPMPSWRASSCCCWAW